MMEGQNVLHHVWLATDEIPLNLLQKCYVTNRDCCVSCQYRLNQLCDYCDCTTTVTEMPTS